jgi:hypothetical protein
VFSIPMTLFKHGFLIMQGSFGYRQRLISPT